MVPTRRRISSIDAARMASNDAKKAFQKIFIGMCYVEKFNFYLIIRIIAGIIMQIYK